MAAKYTVELITLLENDETKALIDKALSTYPLYEKKSKEQLAPSYVPTRSELNQKILNYYKYREIGFETIGRFLDELETAMVEIMPKYNMLFFSIDQDYNILYNVDYTRDTDIKKTGKVEGQTDTNSDNTVNSKSVDDTTTTSSIDSNSKDVHSATPQNELSVPAANIDNIPYADDVNWHKTHSEDTGTSKGTTTNDTTSKGVGKSVTKGSNEDSEIVAERVKGNYGQVSIQSLIDQYRDLIINVEQMIINDRRIAELFMLVY